MSIETSTIEVQMPAMGDSVAEGTILEWRKSEGDTIAADETLVEISTDKVDAEVPSPVSGTIVKLHGGEGDTVTVGAVLAEIAPGDGNGSGNGTSAPAPQDQAPTDEATNGGAPAEVKTIDIETPAGGESVSEGTILEWSVVPERLTVEALVRLPTQITMLVGQAWLADGAVVTPDAEHDDFEWWPADPAQWPPQADEPLRLTAQLVGGP